jgi:hypothetical protein
LLRHVLGQLPIQRLPHLLMVHLLLQLSLLQRPRLTSEHQLPLLKTELTVALDLVPMHVPLQHFRALPKVQLDHRPGFGEPEHVLYKLNRLFPQASRVAHLAGY